MKRKFRIFYVYFDFPDIMPIHTFEVIDQLARKNHSLYVFANSSIQVEIQKKWESYDVKIINVKSWNRKFVFELTFLFSLFYNLFRWSLKVKADVIYIRHASASLLGALIGRIFNTPTFIEINDNLIRRLQKIEITFAKKLWIKFYERFSLPYASKILPVTEGLKNWIIDEFNVKSENIHTVPNGVNTRRFSPGNTDSYRDRFGIPRDAFIIGYLGSLYHWAGLENLIEAAPQVIKANPSALFIIGGGQEPYLTLLKKMVKKFRVTNYFKFYGTIAWDDASAFINTFDLAVAPANFDNTSTGISSQKVLAYFACAKPVVGSDIAGLGDLIQKEKIGNSFQMGSSEELGESIIELMSDKKGIKEVGNRARRYVLENKSWEIMVNRILNCFNDVLEESC